MCSVMIVVFKSWPFYFFSNLNWFYIFLFSDCHGKTFKTKLNKSGKRGHACLVPDIRGNAFSFSPLRMMFATGLSSVQFRHSVVSDSLRPYGLQHTRLPCSSPTARAYSNSCPLGQWCHPTISSSFLPFSSCPQSSPASGSFPMSEFFPKNFPKWPKYWSFSVSMNPSNKYSGLISFRNDWLDLLAVQGTLRVFYKTTVQNHQFFGAQLSLYSNSHIHIWLLEKP